MTLAGPGASRRLFRGGAWEADADAVAEAMLGLGVICGCRMAPGAKAANGTAALPAVGWERASAPRPLVAGVDVKGTFPGDIIGERPEEAAPKAPLGGKRKFDARSSRRGDGAAVAAGVVHMGCREER